MIHPEEKKREGEWERDSKGNVGNNSYRYKILIKRIRGDRQGVTPRQGKNIGIETGLQILKQKWKQKISCSSASRRYGKDLRKGGESSVVENETAPSLDCRCRERERERETVRRTDGRTDTDRHTDRQTGGH